MLIIIIIWISSTVSKMNVSLLNIFVEWLLFILLLHLLTHGYLNVLYQFLFLFPFSHIILFVCYNFFYIFIIWINITFTIPCRSRNVRVATSVRCKCFGSLHLHQRSCEKHEGERSWWWLYNTYKQVILVPFVGYIHICEIKITVFPLITYLRYTYIVCF